MKRLVAGIRIHTATASRRQTRALGLTIMAAVLSACNPPAALEPARPYAYPETPAGAQAGLRSPACSAALPALARRSPVDSAVAPAATGIAPSAPVATAASVAPFVAPFDNASGHAASSVAAPRFAYRVRTPANLDPGFAHPLLVVYAAATANAERSERFTQLTAEATGRGFIVAYVDHRPMTRPGVTALGGVAQSVVERWCIDPERVFFTGHSDGATVSTALSLLPDSRDRVAGIAVSAAGFNAQDLQELGCRTPMPVMVMHGSQDRLFPGWGREAARWWAACNGCSPTPSEPDADGCAAYPGCRTGAAVLYCEGPQSHTEWPGLQRRMVDFLLAGKPAETARAQPSRTHP